jgi:hypothetical protein
MQKLEELEAKKKIDAKKGKQSKGGLFGLFGSAKKKRKQSDVE